LSTSIPRAGVINNVYFQLNRWTTAQYVSTGLT